MTFAKPSASTEEGGEIRNTNGLPDVVILSADEVSTSIGIWYSINFGITASVNPDPQAPISADTLSRTISFSATAADSVGLLLLSSTISSMRLPSAPPLVLTSSAAILAPLATYPPDAANA